MRTPERNEFLTDILCCAVEGGTGYWAAASNYRWDCPPDQAGVTLHELNDDETAFDGTEHKVTLDTIETGIQRVIDGHVRLSPTMLGWIVDGNNENYAGMIDSDCADCIVQAALFGKLVYG